MSVAEVINNLPTNKLIDCVSKAIGKVYEPIHVKRMAEAKAYEINVIAEELRNNSDVPIVYNNDGTIADASNYEELTKRAGHRLAYQETKKQENIESVIGSAYKELEGKELETDENVDEDWMFRLINSVEDISNEKMQQLWGKILAGEIIRPNSFSLRTLDILRNLNQNEAKLFEKICGYVIENKYVYNDNEVLEQVGITYQDILTLDECGLINSSSFIVQSRTLKKGISVMCTYDKYALITKLEEDDVELSYNVYNLSKAGEELYKIVDKETSKKYIMEFANSINKKNEKINIEVHLIKGHEGENYICEKEDLLKYN